MEEIYQENAKLVYRFLLKNCHDSQLAEELTQETFLRAMNSIERYDYGCKISVWLCQIAKPSIPEQETDADPQHCQYHCNPFALWRPLLFSCISFYFTI